MHFFNYAAREQKNFIVWILWVFCVFKVWVCFQDWCFDAWQRKCKIVILSFKRDFMLKQNSSCKAQQSFYQIFTLQNWNIHQGNIKMHFEFQNPLVWLYIKSFICFALPCAPFTKFKWRHWNNPLSSIVKQK